MAHEELFITLHDHLPRNDLRARIADLPVVAIGSGGVPLTRAEVFRFRPVLALGDHSKMRGSDTA